MHSGDAFIVAAREIEGCNFLVIVHTRSGNRQRPAIIRHRIGKRYPFIFPTIVIYQNLVDIYGESVEIVKENKLLTVKIGSKTFKIDLIEQRPPKK